MSHPKRFFMFTLCFVLLASVALYLPDSAVEGQGDELTFEFAQFADNPVLSSGVSGDWDVGGFYGQSIVEHEGTIYLFYVGLTQLNTPNFSARVGYATSTDGYNWVKSPDNPIIDGGSLFTHAAVACSMD